jgi:hypothetical protein
MRRKSGKEIFERRKRRCNRKGGECHVILGFQVEKIVTKNAAKKEGGHRNCRRRR